MRSPFPLQWPEGSVRTPSRDVRTARFKTGLHDALETLYSELDRMNASNVVVSSNLPRRANGRPYGNHADNGVAVWFVIGGKERVLACDRWSQAADNVQAIALTISALRGMERWGCCDVVTKAFQGFTALPAAGETSTGSSWRDVLRVEVVYGTMQSNDAKQGWSYVFPRAGGQLADINRMVLEEAKNNFRELMRAAHPDHGGSHERSVELNNAMAEAERELAGQT